MAEVQDFAISHNTKFKLWQPHGIKNARLFVCKILDCIGAVGFGGPLNLAALCGRIARIMPKAGSAHLCLEYLPPRAMILLRLCRCIGCFMYLRILTYSPPHWTRFENHG